MAWDSAEYFRKHKKIVFAVLTVIAMFVFIIGDPLSSRGFGNNQGQKRSRSWFSTDDSDLVATVEGHKYYLEDFSELSYKRTMMLNFIGAVEIRGRAMVFRQMGFTDQEMLEIDRLNQIMRQYGQFASQMMNQLPERMRRLWTRYNEARNANFELWQLSMVSRDSLCMDYLQNWQRMEDPNTGRSFGIFERGTGREFSAPDTIVDSLYWKARADSMGVVLTSKQVIDDLLRCGRDRLTEGDLQSIRISMQVNMTLDEILKEIQSELRGTIARGVLLGDQYLKLGQLTPLDLWDGYVQLKTKLEVGILPVAVMDKEFTNKVPEPKTEELKAFFNKFKDKLPDESSDTPGFKVPRLSKIAYVYGNLRETQPARKHYEKQVQLLNGLNPLYFHLQLLDEYARRSMQFRTQELVWDMRVGSGPGSTEVRLHTLASQPIDAMSVAQVLASASHSVLTPFNGHVALVTMRPTFRMLSAKEQALMQAAQFLGMGNAAALNWTYLITAYPAKRVFLSTVVKPFDEVYDLMKYDYIEEQCRKELQRDLTYLQSVLNEYGKRYTEKRIKWRNIRRTTNIPFEPPLYDETKKQTLDAFMSEFAQFRGLQYFVSKNALPQDELINETLDPTISTLKSLFKPQYGLSTPQKQLDNQIASRLVEADKPYEWREIKPTFELNWSEIAMYWQSERTEERIPTYEEAEPKVRIAWMQQQARTYAEEAAKRAAAEVKKQPDGIRLLIDRPGYKGKESIARFQLSTNQAAATSITYEPAPVPVIEHPPTDLVQQVFDALKQPGDSLVVWNQPKTICYLIVLVDRNEPKPDDLRAREDFDFKVIVPGRDRQIQVQMGNFGGVAFNRFVLAEKLVKEQKNWMEFLKKSTQYNETLAKKLTERQ